MNISKCKNCTKNFKPTRKFRTYCSGYCRNVYKKKYSRKKKKNFLRTQYWSVEQKKYVNLRSSYELTYAMYLSLRGIRWLYEARKFYMEDGKHYYLPDFYLIESNEYIEVKGRWYKHSKKKFESFKKLYPNEKITVVGTPEITAIRKQLKIQI